MLLDYFMFARIVRRNAPSFLVKSIIIWCFARIFIRFIHPFDFYWITLIRVRRNTFVVDFKIKKINK